MSGNAQLGVRKLLGNVKMRQGDVIMDCDSAYFYSNRNAVDAFGNVHIVQGDSLDIYADSLKYNGDEKIADLYDNVKLIEPRMTLTTKRLTYNMVTKQAKYAQGGHVIGSDMDLISKRGYYYSESRMAYFRDSVVVIGADYDLIADTLGYNLDNETSYFYGPTDIKTTNNTIYCESGWYATKTGKSIFGRNTILYDGPQVLYADSLYYDQKTGLGKAYKDFVWKDTSMNILLSGREAIFQKEDQRIFATDSAMLTYIMNGDSLFMVADTLRSMKDTNDIREFVAYYDVRIYKSDLQGLCDSLFFSYKDSMIRMYDEPILWSDANQLTGDTILMTLKNNTLDAVELFENGFIISKSAEGGLYDQIKGRHIFGYFVDGKMDRMHAVGNGETIYYGKDARTAYIGANKAVSSDMWIYVRNNRVARINFLKEPVAKFTPIQQLNPKNFLLADFLWREDERPLSKADLFVRDSITTIDSSLNTATDTTANYNVDSTGSTITVDSSATIVAPEPVPVSDEDTNKKKGKAKGRKGTDDGKLED